MSINIQKSTSSITPPSWFECKEINPLQALTDIRNTTDNYKNINNSTFIEKFNENMEYHFENNKSIIFGYIPAPPETYPNRTDIIKKIIGENGHWLKTTTEKTGIHFIWYDKAQNKFMFWAPCHSTIYNAMNAIRWRIIKYGNFAFNN
jgi:hypothetical protein